MTNLLHNNHRRYNPLLSEWVVVAENRVNRPWNGAQTKKPAAGFDQANQTNSLAPGGARVQGKITPEYLDTFVFDNDFPTFTDYLKEKQDTESNLEDDFLFQKEEIRGVCRVICYHPDSMKTIPLMTKTEVLAIVATWLHQFNELKEKYDWIQIFENRGAAVGCSNPHPHGQLWAGDFIPSLPSRKDKHMKDYFVKFGKNLLLTYLQKEVEKKERIVLRNADWTVLVPYWAFWPYETMLIPNRHVKRMDELRKSEQDSLADILKQLLSKYDNIFKCVFPYSMGWLGAPTGRRTQDNYEHWQLHASFHPPLLRSATVPKYLAGYEVFAEPQRDITPEAAAETIRAQCEIPWNENDKQT